MRVAEQKTTPATPEPTRTRVRFPVLDKLMEAGWLAAVGLVPLVVAHDTWMVGFVQMAKIGVFRTIILFLAAAWVLKWAMEWRATALTSEQQVAAWQAHPGRFVFLGAAAVLLATLISLAFSPVKSIGIWGIDTGWDTYGLVNIVLYLILFGAVATNLKTRDQVQRLLWTVIASAVLVSLYGIAQHFGIDPFRTIAQPARRANLSFGNPIFAGSFLVMTIPLTVTAVLSVRDRLGTLEHVAFGTALLAPQVTAMVFTLSRGPWVGLAVGTAVLLALLYWAGGLSWLRRAALIIALSAAIAVVFDELPVPGGIAGEGALGDRIESIVPELGGGLTNRWTIWVTSGEVFLTRPWVDTNELPEVPGLAAPWLRPVVGYGPDMFGYVYPLAGEHTYTFELATHGHNFVIHTLLEMGVLGVAAYAFLGGAAGFLLYRLVRSARAGGQGAGYLLLLLGLSAAFIGRMVEQIPGKAQVSDLTLSWVFAGLIVALAVMRPPAEPGLEHQAAPALRRRRAERRRTAQGRGEPLSVSRIMGASALVVLILAFWVIHVASPVNAAFITVSAQRAANAGNVQRMVDEHQRAVSTYPALTVTRFRLAQAVFQIAQSTADEEQRANLMQFSYNQMLDILARNPLDHRALTRAAEYHRELGVLEKATKEESLREALVLAGLMPGFWQSQATLAWSYVRLQDYEAALEAVTRAKELDNGTRETQLIYYVEAFTLAELGRMEEALAAVEISLERQETEQARQLRDRLLDE